MARKALVLGGQGVVGSFIARALREAGWEVTRGGRRPEEADDFRLVDLDRGDTVEPACAEADLVVTSVHHPGLHAERAVLRDGGVLLHLDEVSTAERERLEREVPEPRGLVLEHTGLGGVSLLSLVELLHDHPDADTAEFGLLLSAAEKSGPAGGLFAKSLMSGRSRHPTATIELPEPFGRRSCIEAGPEATDAIVGRFAGDRTPRLYGCFVPRAFGAAMLALNAVHLLSRLPQAAWTAGRGKVPEELSSQQTMHWARVLRGGEVLGARFVHAKGDYRSTVAATAIYADTLVPASGAELPRRGIFGLPEVLDLRELEPALAEKGIRVERAGAGVAANAAARSTPAAAGG
jgi:NAD dependent epimerase/dehydratase family